MRTWNDAVKKALELLLHRDEYAYYYGAKNVRLTMDTMLALEQASPDYFSKYSPAELDLIHAFSLNKIGLDCSALTSLCTEDFTYSEAQMSHCPDKNADISGGVAGSLLFTSFGGAGRHIGIDVGHGYYIHMPSEGKSVTLGRFKEGVCNWELSGRTSYLDYNGATAD